jgi:hypothetical protein
MSIASSPDRNTFQLNNYIKRCKEKNEDPNEDYLNFFKTSNELNQERINDPAWRENNLEYDLRTTDWILEKVKEDTYAQNLYAALCNIQWQKCDVFPILKDEFWNCSWRYAGGIIADMRQEGDYIDWYCSGIRTELSDEEFNNLNADRQLAYKLKQAYVNEGIVTDEIECDLKKIGWRWSIYSEDKL